MRLRKDASSYRATGLARKLKPMPDAPHYRSKKNTRKWCQGRVGQQHVWELRVPINSNRWSKTKQNVCTKCGKQSYKNMLYWCRIHSVYYDEKDEAAFWNDEHTHA